MRALSTAVFEVRDCSPRQPKHTLLGMSWVQVTVNLAKEAKNYLQKTSESSIEQQESEEPPQPTQIDIMKEFSA